MLSISGKKWTEISVNNTIIEKAKIENNFSDLISKIVISRRFTEFEINSIRNVNQLYNPFHKFKDFQKAKLILENSLKNDEKIIIVGDYDVDGCVSTSLIINFFNLLNKNVEYYIPNRFKDGYGASLSFIKKIVKKKPDLIIMVDCGSNSHDSINFLNSKKVKSMVIDHHDIYKPYPPCNCLINPKKECDYNEFDYFCSSTIVYFFLELILKDTKKRNIFKENLTYVLLATICDVMPLRKLNRSIAIDVLNNDLLKKDYLFKKILEFKKINRPLEIEDFSFLIGPILNAAGRLNDANDVVNLITCQNKKIKDKLILKLIKINEKRKQLESRIINKIDINKFANTKNNVLIIHNEMINEGLIGIIASRFKDYFNKPSIVMTLSNNIFKASARSTFDFDMGKFIKKCIDKDIILNGGGHHLAAGFSLKKDKIDEFIYFINQSYKKKETHFSNQYASKISLNAINSKFYNEIKILGPFGPLNEEPLFLIENIKVLAPKILKDKFISFYAKSKTGKMVPSVSFNLIESEQNKRLLNTTKEISLIAKIKENFWNNKKNLQLIVLDVITETNKA